jgi:hypothetical protein
MGDVWFTEDDVRRQLEELGYKDVNDDILKPFMQGGPLNIVFMSIHAIVISWLVSFLLLLFGRFTTVGLERQCHTISITRLRCENCTWFHQKPGPARAYISSIGCRQD